MGKNTSETSEVRGTKRLTANTLEWRRDKASALTETQRKRSDTRGCQAPLELRDATEEGNSRILRSYASLFDTPYMVGGGSLRYQETVNQGAFKRSLGSSPDVVFRFDHAGPPLARTSSGTLRLGEDARGLWYEADLNLQDRYVREELIPKIERGDLRESSFAFRCISDSWSDDYSERALDACELDRGDVSIVTFGASPQTREHMSLRFDEQLDAIRSVGYEAFIEAWVEWRNFTLIPIELREGKVISSQSMEVLRNVLGMISEADENLDESQALLSDLMGVPQPGEADAAATVASHGGPLLTNAASEGTEAREKEGEERDDPTSEDWDVAYGLKNAKLALASVKATQLTDPDYETDPDDAAVMANIEAAEAAIDAAIVTQSKDGRRDPEENSQRSAEALPTSRIDEFELRLASS